MQPQPEFQKREQMKKRRQRRKSDISKVDLTELRRKLERKLVFTLTLFLNLKSLKFVTFKPSGNIISHIIFKHHLMCIDAIKLEWNMFYYYNNFLKKHHGFFDCQVQLERCANKVATFFT